MTISITAPSGIGKRCKHSDIPSRNIALLTAWATPKPAGTYLTRAEIAENFHLSLSQTYNGINKARERVGKHPTRYASLLEAIQRREGAESTPSERDINILAAWTTPISHGIYPTFKEIKSLFGFKSNHRPAQIVEATLSWLERHPNQYLELYEKAMERKEIVSSPSYRDLDILSAWTVRDKDGIYPTNEELSKEFTLSSSYICESLKTVRPWVESRAETYTRLWEAIQEREEIESKPSFDDIDLLTAWTVRNENGTYPTQQALAEEFGSFQTTVFYKLQKTRAWIEEHRGWFPKFLEQIREREQTPHKFSTLKARQ